MILDYVIGGMQKHQSITKDGICTCLTAAMGCGGGYVPMVIEKQQVRCLGNLYGESRGTGFAGNVWDKEYCCPTITTAQGGGRQPMIIEQAACRLVRTEEGKKLRKSYENGEIHHGFNEHRELEPEKEKSDSVIRYRIRKLTPRECWRLMGYTDEDFDKASAVNSNTQLYKQAGNAIVKQVLMAIFSQLNIKGVTAWNERNKTA